MKTVKNHPGKAFILFLSIYLQFCSMAAVGEVHDSHAPSESLCEEDDAEGCRQRLGKNSPGEFDSYVVGENRCYMAQGYFPKSQLLGLLPESMSIPDDTVMSAFYPGTKLKQDSHPFLLSFCHGAGIHDVYTKMNVPEQEELMFVIPVIYNSEQGGAGLFSYVPVLYLDSFMGVVGGLVFGLRKEYHPGLETVEAKDSKRWVIDGLIDASFKLKDKGKLDSLPQFVEQIFSTPFVTESYPIPFARTVVYETRVFPLLVSEATEQFQWNYNGKTIASSEDTWSIYAEYRFDMSQSAGSKKYFERLSAH